MLLSWGQRSKQIHNISKWQLCCVNWSSQPEGVNATAAAASVAIGGAIFQTYSLMERKIAPASTLLAASAVASSLPQGSSVRLSSIRVAIALIGSGEMYTALVK